MLQCQKGGSIYSLAVTNQHIICGTYENKIYVRLWWGAQYLHMVGCPGHTYGGVPSTYIWWGAQDIHMVGCPGHTYGGVPSTYIWWGAQDIHTVGCPVLTYGGVPSTYIWWGAQYLHMVGCPVHTYRGVYYLGGNTVPLQWPIFFSLYN